MPRPNPFRLRLRIRRASLGLTIFKREAGGSPATNWLRRGAPARSASAAERRSSPTGHSSRPRRRSAGSTSSNARAWKKPSRSRPDTQSPKRGRSRSGRSGENDGAHCEAGGNVPPASCASGSDFVDRVEGSFAHPAEPREARGGDDIADPLLTRLRSEGQPNILRERVWRAEERRECVVRPAYRVQVLLHA